VPAGDRPKSVPELMASPATDGGARPTALTSAPSTPSGDYAVTARRHHSIKTLIASKRRPAAVVSVPEKDYTGSARN